MNSQSFQFLRYNRPVLADLGGLEEKHAYTDPGRHAAAGLERRVRIRARLDQTEGKGGELDSWSAAPVVITSPSSPATTAAGRRLRDIP
jgi:hypothetical protein